MYESIASLVLYVLKGTVRNRSISDTFDLSFPKQCSEDSQQGCTKAGLQSHRIIWETTMKTYLIQGAQIAQFDKALLAEISFLEKQAPQGNINKGWRIAVENEEGDLYRIVEVDDLAEKKEFQERLIKASFWLDPLAPSAPKSFHGIIKFGTQ